MTGYILYFCIFFIIIIFYSSHLMCFVHVFRYIMYYFNTNMNEKLGHSTQNLNANHYLPDLTVWSVTARLELVKPFGLNPLQIQHRCPLQQS